MMFLKARKIQRCLGEFRKYRMSNREIINVCSHSGGVLGIRVNSFVGLFDTLLHNYKISAKQVR